MTPDAADGNTQQGQAAPVPQGMSRPRRSPVKRVRRGEETQGSGRGISACGSSERSGLCVDEGAGREPDTDHQPERRGEGIAHQMTPDAADGNTQQGQAAPVPQGMSRPRRSPVKRVRRGEETQGSGRGISACGSSERSGLCVDEGAGREPDFDHQSERRGEGAAHQVTELPKWVHPRLRGYDYSRSGGYFLTLCTQGRAPILSEIVGRGLPLPDSVSSPLAGLRRRS